MVNPAGSARDAADGFAQHAFTPLPERTRRFADAILKHVDPTRPLHILDLGCGAGSHLFELAAALPRAALVGIDISPASIGQANKMRAAHPAKDRLRFVAADYLTFQSSPFDVILSDSVLQLIDAQNPKLYAKLGADLAPDGLLVISIPYACPYNFGLSAVRAVFRAMRSPMTDEFVLWVARLLHGRDYDEALLKQRIVYLYLRHYRREGAAMARDLARVGLQRVARISVPHASPAQMKHTLTIYRKVPAR